MTILAKVRKNPDYIHATRLLDELGIAWELCPPMGKGHPFLRIGRLRWPIASTPGGRIRTGNVVAQLGRFLREKGVVE